MKTKINIGPITALLTQEQFARIIRGSSCTFLCGMLPSGNYKTYNSIRHQLFSEFKSVVRKMYKYTKVYLRLCYSFKDAVIASAAKRRFLSLITKIQCLDGNDPGLICGNI